MQAYAACDDPDVREVVRNGFGDLVAYAERVSGQPAEAITRFFATGMLLNVGAAISSHDGIVRMRPNNGLLVQRGESSIDAERLADLTGEVVVTERAFIDGTTLAGILPRAVLLVENLGPYLDLAAPSGWLVVHVPGWNTATVRVLLDRLGDVPLVHFGDLDPNGVRIAAHLRTARPGLRWAVPDFWREHVPGRTQRLAWPEDLVWINAPDLVRELAQAGLWLEQETIALDPRLRNALEQVLGT